MQTFLPYADFRRSAQALDLRRLGKQRVEAIQVIRAISRPGYGWRHHPAAKMWRGHLEALGRYGLTMADEWVRHGFADTTADTMIADVAAGGVDTIRSEDELRAAGLLPPWIGDDALHLSHRSALVRKDPAHYRPLFGDVPDDLPYVWPGPPLIGEERPTGTAGS